MSQLPARASRISPGPKPNFLRASPAAAAPPAASTTLWMKDLRLIVPLRYRSESSSTALFLIMAPPNKSHLLSTADRECEQQPEPPRASNSSVNSPGWRSARLRSRTERRLLRQQEGEDRHLLRVRLAQKRARDVHGCGFLLLPHVALSVSLKCRRRALEPVAAAANDARNFVR